MNVAQSYDAEGQRIECATLYSPFIRFLHVPKRRAKARSEPVEPKKKWPEVIIDGLKKGPCSAVDLWTRCKGDKDNKASFHRYLSEMARDGRIQRYGDQQPYCYGVVRNRTTNGQQ